MSEFLSYIISPRAVSFNDMGCKADGASVSDLPQAPYLLLRECDVIWSITSIHRIPGP